jgi:type II secretory pathway pseudopilin PulG
MSHFFKKRLTGGFSLIELLVSIGISITILTVVVVNQAKYTSASSLSNAAHSLSSSITEAQTYGVSVKEFNAGFNAAYGIQLKDSSVSGGGSNTEYIFFADHNTKNTRYDGAWGNAGACPTSGPSANECIKKLSFGSNITYPPTIGLNFCYINSSNVCSNTVSGGARIRRVDIVFVRPDTKAVITVFTNGNANITPTNMIGVQITLYNPSTLKTKNVRVYSSGQVSVI